LHATGRAISTVRRAISTVRRAVSTVRRATTHVWRRGSVHVRIGRVTTSVVRRIPA
jgi:hypothetical protein